MELRRIRPEEHDAAGDVCVAAYRPFLTGAEDDYAERLHDVATRAAQAEVWVALVDGRVVGNVTYCPPGSPWREIGRDHEGEFRMLAVAPDAQGLGVARALVRRCFERCRELGLETMAICSMPQMTAAHGLYREFGFDRAESLDWSPVDGIELWGFRVQVRQDSSGGTQGG